MIKKALSFKTEVKFIMMRKHYTSQFKTKIVLTILQGEKELNEICSENNLNPNMVRKWKQEFLENAHFAFDNKAEEKNSKREEKKLKKSNDQMLKTIGQLTLERDFLQGCFRQLGEEPPQLPNYD